MSYTNHTSWSISTNILVVRTLVDIVSERCSLEGNNYIHNNQYTNETIKEWMNAVGKWTVILIPEVATAVYMDNISLSEIYMKKI